MMVSVTANMALKIREYAELVKFEHTVFALPFALSAMLLAAPQNTWPPPLTVLWVLLAMVGGRTFAMALNRLIDAEIDGGNPRTQSRSIPAGRVKKLEAALLALASAGILVFATFQLPLICRQLLPLAFGILVLYSYVKRFSNLAHLVLGLALGSSAIGGWLAVSGELTWLPVIFGLAVLFWVTGFDIIYACQDIDYDKRTGLYSLPVSFGIGGALRLSKVFHALAILALVSFGLLYPHAGYGYWLSVAVTAGMLVYEHSLVSADDLSKVNEAFFTVNGRISLLVFILILVDKLF